MASPARFGHPPRVDDLPFLAAVPAAAAVGGLLVALSAYAFSPFALPAALIAVTFVVVTLVRPAWGLAGAMAAVAGESFGITVGGASPAEAGLEFVGASWVARVVIRPETVAMPRLRDAPVIALLGVIAIGLAYAQIPTRSPAYWCSGRCSTSSTSRSSRSRRLR